MVGELPTSQDNTLYVRCHLSLASLPLSTIHARQCGKSVLAVARDSGLMKPFYCPMGCSVYR
jgi:hypothetical protein